MAGDGGKRLIVGAMSGTSADGVDAAVVEITGHGLDMKPRLLAHRHVPYADELRRGIFAARTSDGATRLADLARYGREITFAYAAAVKEATAAAGVAANEVAAVAAHGQTLYHAPPDTMQVLDPALLAAEVGCAVVSDFRRADCAAGGQGAPLVPFADYVMFRDPQKTRVLLNIGGIANITVLPAGGAPEGVVAFDTGPGNCISDWVCRTKGAFGLSWDVDGAGASRGRVLSEVRDRFLSMPYFSAPPPKSTDGPTMVEGFAAAIQGADHVMNDLLATAAYVTAATIAGAINHHVQRAQEDMEVVASGGGVQNRAIMTWLRSLLGPGWTIRSSVDLGIPTDAKEAVAFALLGAATLDGIPSNVPSATGARRRVVLGSVTPRP